MEEEFNIAKNYSGRKKWSTSALVLLAVALITGTFLRVSLLFIYPLLVIFLLGFFRFRISASFLILFFILCSGLMLSLFSGLFLKYKILSLFYMLPFLILLFSSVGRRRSLNEENLNILFNCLAMVALINDLIGIIQVIRTPNSDDSFTGIYSLFSVSLNGLMVLNAIVFYYFFVRFIQYRKLTYGIPALIFLCSAILGFYGAGLIIFIAAFILSFFRFRLKDVLRTFGIGLLCLLVIYYGMLIVKPQVVQYNKENLQRIITFDPNSGPRKIRSFYNYGISYPHHTRDFLFGSGPGTFNSRTAFMVGSPSYFQLFTFIKDERQPYYFKNYAYSLWNDSNTSKQLYLDGFRNQPFSSLLAFLGEYGLFFTAAFFILYYRYYRITANLFYGQKEGPEDVIRFRVFKFLMILLPLLMLIDNYVEYPEITLLVLLGIKFADADLQSSNQISL